MRESLYPAPSHPTAVLALAEGTVLKGYGLGAVGKAVGEVCFNTSLTGYQEILTDPSYAGQLITFTFPHIGNVGCNDEDEESRTPAARGCILGTGISEPSNWRARQHLADWLKSRSLVGLYGVDTRQLTHLIRKGGAPNGVIQFAPDGAFDIPALIAEAKAWPGLEGMDLAIEVTCQQSYSWREGQWHTGQGFTEGHSWRHHVVAVDYGAKYNILRCLVENGCRVTVVPATATAEDILAHRPDGLFLSNGPGDPNATGQYAVPVIKALLAANLPIFGICLGHQLLALALGGQTEKMHQGHRGANHPVKDLRTDRVEITSQNHGFVVVSESLPKSVELTHVSLFDGSCEGLALRGKPVFSVQYHPEASPGPKDSQHLFARFAAMMDQVKG